MRKTKPNIAVLIVAGGSGTRMGHDLPKQYMTIQGKSVLSHTIDVFESVDEVSTIFCVIGEGHQELYQQAMKNSYPHKFCIGGSTRQQSVYNGLMAIKNDNPDIVLIHDAARPCVTKKDIHRLIHSVEESRSATLAQQVTESLQRDGCTVNRDNLWIMQTPQGFYFDDILTAHKEAKDEYTDDTAVYSAWSGKSVTYVPCGRHNLKITTMDDLIMAEKLLSMHDTTETVTGFGFDVHAFEEKDTESIRLCGINIPHNRSLEGHSDADIGLHVLTDAILGGLAEHDIGYHFPSSDESIRNMDSHVFLDKALEMVAKHQASIRHIDLTLICEAPNVSKHRDAMREHLSDYMKLPLSRISIKGTTTQKLGFTGRKEGIAAQAVVTLRIPTHD